MSQVSDVEGARRGLLLVISSPSGAGKTSLGRRLLADHPELSVSISCTTRPPRPGERDGREYHFVSPERFAAMVAAGEFLEWAEVHEHRYGTPAAAVEAALAEGRDLLFDIDWQGAEAIVARHRAETVPVFILPPSLAALAERLRGRAQDSEAVIARRLARAAGEIAHWRDYDYVLINADFEAVYADLAAIYHAERLKRTRNPWIEPFVQALG